MPTFASPLKNKATLKWSFGEVAEWSIAAVLKTVVLRGTRGSNPCLSAEVLLILVKSRFYEDFFCPLKASAGEMFFLICFLTWKWLTLKTFENPYKTINR
jgi:hypothetical protein